MAFVHHRWEKNGRLLRDDADPTKYSWSSTVADDENVDLGNGSYAAYVWDGTTLKYGRSETVFHADRQEHKFNGETIISDQRFHLDVDTGAGFQQVISSGPPTVAVEQNDDHAVVILTHSATLPVGGQPITWQTKIRVQSGNTVRYSQHITSPIALTARVRSTNDGMERLSPQADSEELVFTRPAGRARPEGTFRRGVRMAKVIWRWEDDEDADREVQVASRGSLRKLDITMNAGSLQAGVEKIISPDTHGPSEITVDNDDGADTGPGSGEWRTNSDGDGHGIFTGQDGGYRFTGLPSNIASATSFDTGSYFEFDTNYSAGSGTVTLRGLEADLTSQSFSDSYIPSDQTQTTASDSLAHGDPEGQGAQFTSITGILDEMDGAGAITNSGAIGFAMSGTTAIYVEDSTSLSGSDQAAQLKINYTTGGGGAGNSKRLLLLGVG